MTTIGILFKARHYASIQVLNQIYYSLLFYFGGIPILPLENHLELSKVQQLEQFEKKNGTATLFTVNESFSMLMMYTNFTPACMFMYDIYHKGIGEALKNMFTPLTDIYHYDAQQQQQQQQQ